MSRCRHPFTVRSASAGDRHAARRRLRRTDRRAGKSCAGERDPHPVFRADGADRPAAGSSVRAVLHGAAGDRRDVPVGGTDDPRVHARSEGRAAERDALRRDDRRVGATAVSGHRLPQAVHVHVHDADGPSRFGPTGTASTGGSISRSSWRCGSTSRCGPTDVAAHVALRYERHDWTPPSMTSQERAAHRRGRIGALRCEGRRHRPGGRVDGAGALSRDADVGCTAVERRPPGSIRGFAGSRGGADRHAPGDGRPGFRSRSTRSSWASRARPRRRGRRRSPFASIATLFVDGPRCRAECDADEYGALRMRRPVTLDHASRRHFSSRHHRERTRGAGAARNSPRDPVPARNGGRTSRSRTSASRQPPAKTYAVTVSAGLQSLDGQTLGYTVAVIVENWHDRAFTSFGDGHGVWETGGGPLPFYARNFTDVWQWASALSARSADADDPAADEEPTSARRRRRRRPPYARPDAGHDPVARPRSVGARCSRRAPGSCGRR